MHLILKLSAFCRQVGGHSGRFSPDGLDFSILRRQPLLEESNLVVLRLSNEPLPLGGRTLDLVGSCTLDSRRVRSCSGDPIREVLDC
jgi:hypothetical protein